MKTLTEQHDELVLKAVSVITETCRPYRANFSGEKFVKLPQKVIVKKEGYNYVSYNEHDNKIHVWRNSDTAGWNSGHEVLNTSLFCEVADLLVKAEQLAYKEPYFGTYLGD